MPRVRARIGLAELERIAVTWLTDEVLSAYIDGELPPEEAARVALALTRDPAATERVAELRAADARLRQAFEAPLPDPDALAHRLAEGMKAAPPRWRAPRRALLGLAGGLAALALALGLAAGRLGLKREVRIDADAGLLAVGDLQAALEAQPSNAAGAVQIFRTFRTDDGRVCRRFGLRASLQGVACRADGRWRLVALVQAGDDLAERASAALGVGATVDAAQEAELIRSGWPVAASDGALERNSLR